MKRAGAILALCALLLVAWAAEATNTLFHVFDLANLGALPTRMVVTPKDEVWFVQTNANRIGKIEPNKEGITEFIIPTKQSAPTDLVMDQAGLIWFIEQDANQLGRFNPKTLEFKEFNIPTFNSLPFHLVLDGQGAIWFTEHYSNQLGRFDIQTETFREFLIPTPDSRPSGLVVDQKGRIWFLETNGNKVTSLDLTDGRFEFQEHPLPTDFSVPRDLVLDTKGKLWFGARSHQELLSFDVNRHEFESFRIPGGGVIESLVVDESERILYSLGRTGKIGIFDTVNKKFTVFDALSNNSRPFGVDVDTKGNIWYTDIAKNSLVQMKGEAVSHLLNR